MEKPPTQGQSYTCQQTDTASTMASPGGHPPTITTCAPPWPTLHHTHGSKSAHGGEGPALLRFRQDTTGPTQWGTALQIAICAAIYQVSIQVATPFGELTFGTGDTRWGLQLLTQPVGHYNVLTEEGAEPHTPRPTQGHYTLSDTTPSLSHQSSQPPSTPSGSSTRSSQSPLQDASPRSCLTPRSSCTSHSSLPYNGSWQCYHYLSIQTGTHCLGCREPWQTTHWGRPSTPRRAQPTLGANNPHPIITVNTRGSREAFIRALQLPAQILLLQEHHKRAPEIPTLQHIAAGLGWQGVWDPGYSEHRQGRGRGTAILARKPLTVFRKQGPQGAQPPPFFGPGRPNFTYFASTELSHNTQTPTPITNF